MVFVLDTSGSVEETFSMMLELVRRIIQGLNFDGGEDTSRPCHIQ